MTSSPSTEATRRQRVSAIVGLSVATAEMVAGGKGRPRLPVYPFAWESYHNGSQLLTADDATIELLSPYNAGADGLIVWGSTRNNRRTGKAIFPAQGGANMQRYFDFVRTVTGPLVAGFQRKLLACSAANCSGHGRCASVGPGAGAVVGAPCECFDGFTGPGCEKLQ